MNDNDDDLNEINFADLVGDVKPIKHDKADLKKPRNMINQDYLRAAATQDQADYTSGMSDELRKLVDSDEALIYARSGVQMRTMRKLKQGNPPWQEGLDLHGFTVEQAREELGQFIRQATRKDLRSVIVVHGKAYSEDGAPAILKSYANDWLQQLPQVLAFVSAQQKDGGTGAVYVLLKKYDAK